MPPTPHVELAKLDFENVFADQEAIRAINPQRYEMEQLNRIIYWDPEESVFAGYKDVQEDEFWIRGHMPGFPLMPGVLMCEAAAQICAWFIVYTKVMEGDFIGFGGLENVRFRKPVKPGDRLLLVAKVVKKHRRQTTCNVQGFVDGAMVFHADVLGTPISSG